MRFTDEEKLWVYDTEVLANKLANKTEREVQEILNKNDVIRLRSTNRPKAKAYNRLVFFILYPFLFVLYIIKWFVTGQGALDSWGKRFKPLGWVMNIIEDVG